MMEYVELQTEIGSQRLVGQEKARDLLKRIIKSGRLGHAYLFSGPAGTGKTALALAFAELINGISNLTDLDNQAFSKKSSWLNHPDIHVFMPVTTDYRVNGLRKRLSYLAKDPYEVVDFSHRPSLADEESSKNKQAFYPIDYFHDEIRPKAFLKPNEGRKTVIILTNIETMRKEAANAFLKILEEPSEDLIFLLTTNDKDTLLPTIISRCQPVQLSTLKASQIQQALIHYDGFSSDDAQYMAQISGGNYVMARYFEIDTLKKMRAQMVTFLRKSYTRDAGALTKMAKDWQKQYNIERQVMLLNVLETLLSDLMIYRNTGEKSLITNLDQIDTIIRFCDSMPDARLRDMIEQVNNCRPLLHRNIQAKLLLTALALRFSFLMRDEGISIPTGQPWEHLPAYIQ
jgi:DNA polymerase-3 subunit delta'